MILLDINMARKKYNNGGLVARKDFKNIAALEGRVAGNQKYQQGTVSGSLKLRKGTLTANKTKDSFGNTRKSYSYTQNIGKNTKLKFDASKGYRGISISKKF
jgi:hypothetical protein